MASVPLTVFLPEVLPLVVACSDTLATTAVRHSAVEFCERTTFWQETQDAVTVTGADFPYDLEAPSGARVIQVMSVAINGTPVAPVSMDELDTAVLNWRDSVGSNPAGYYQLSPYQMGLYPALNTSVEMVLRAAYAPTRTAKAIEEFVYQVHVETISSGALYRLMAMPGQPWSNPELAAFYRSKFQQGVMDAQIEANKTFGRARMSVIPRAFA